MRSSRHLLSSSALGLALLLAGAGHAAAPPAPAIDLAPQWRLVGPLRGGWAEMIEGIPGHAESFLFGASGGGVWRTDDAGRVWRPLFDHGPTAPIGAVAVAPTDGDTFYIGSGQPEPRYDVASGVGVFRSTDGGKSWQSAGLEKTAHIGRLWVDPRDAKTLLVAAVGDFFAPNAERGVFRSTDGGRSWAHVLKIDADTGAVDLTADPKDPNRIYAAAWQARQYPWQSYFTQVAGPGSGVFQSADGGVTWNRLGGQGWPAGPLGRISLAATRTATGLRLYAVVSAGAASGLYRSDNGGGAWALVNGEKAFTGYYASRVTVDPADPDVVWLVGQSIRRCDQGGTRCEIVKGAPGGDDYHSVWIDPVHGGHMAITSDQGAQISVDGGSTWSSWYNQATGQFYHLATDDRVPYRIYSGQQDSGTVGILSRSDYGAIGLRDWTSVGSDERDYDIPDPEDPDIVYGSGLGGKVNRYDARTGQSADVSPFPYANYGQRQTSTAHHFVWVTPIALSRVGPTTLYEGGEVVWASTDHGDHWQIISPDLTGKTSGAQRCDGDIAVASARACGYGGIWSLTASPRHAGELWAGTDDGLVQMTRDGGQHWLNVTPPGVPDWAKIATVDVSSLADGVAYVAVDNQRQGDRQPHAYVTHDYGATWKDIAADLPRDHFAAVVRADTARPGLIFAGTDVGVLASWDDGAHWQALQGDLPTAWVRDLLVHGDDLVAATQGRAIWSLGDLALLRQAPPQATWRGSHLFDPAPALRIRANANKDTPFPAEEPTGQNPPAGAIIDYWLPTGAKGPVTLDILDAAGVRVRRLGSEPNPPPPTEPYFTRAWLKPQLPLATGAGLHHALWDLHWSRPPAMSFDYSIATAAGTDTALSPQGPLALPGDYQLVLTVGGVASRASLRLTQDPRSRASAADLKASLDLSLAIDSDLAVARRGFGETSLAKKTLEGDLARLKAPGGGGGGELALRVAAVIAAIGSPPAGPNFLQASAELGGIESGLEGADAAPTAPQTEARLAMRARLDVLWSAWAILRDGQIASLTSDLTRAGLAPVNLPAAEGLKISLPDDGEDLP